VNRRAVFILPQFFARHSWPPNHFCLTAAAAIAVTGLRFSQADWKM
jgi:hypothetical protein